MKYKDYYEVLGVPRDADAETIKKAYRKLARKHHPDVAKAADSEARFKEVAEAYATLKDPEKRAAFDQLGAHRPGEEFTPPRGWQHAFAEQGEAFAGVDLGDLDLADLLAAFGRGRGARHAGGTVPLRGRDYEAAITIPLEAAYRGTTVSLDVQHEDGTRTLAVTVPPGVTQGQRLRLRGKGGGGRHGGPAGDIYLHITLAPHPVFRASGADLYFDLPLAPWEAALGAEVPVPTLDGELLLTVPPGTPTGRKLRIRSRGLAGQGGRGDLYAIVQVQVPTTLTDRERELFQELARGSRFDPRASLTRKEAHGTEP